VSYRITLTNGTLLTTVADTTIDNTTSLALIGRNFSGYGGAVAENFVHILENYANVTAPLAPLVGQLWYNTTSLSLEVWNGIAWVSAGFPGDGDVDNSTLILTNPSCPANQRKWRIMVSNTSPYIGMLVFQALNDDLTIRNTVMALDGVNDLIIGDDGDSGGGGGSLLFNDGGVLGVPAGASWPASAGALAAGSFYSNGGVATIVPGGTPVVSAAVFFGSITASALLALGGNTLPIVAPTIGSLQLWNNGDEVWIA
jgi:hypothetical protein